MRQKAYCMTIQLKGIEQSFPVVLSVIQYCVEINFIEKSMFKVILICVKLFP